MILQFVGADHEVTGSCHYIECGDTKLIVDYGMEQGVNLFQNKPLPVSPAELDYVLLTHAHIDHSGMLPFLYKDGFNGTILATNATAELANIMLLDCAHIQESEAEYKNRKNTRSGKPLVDPVYTTEDAKETIKMFHGVRYNELVELSDNVSVRFIDAGHLLGSASIEVYLKEGDIEKKIVFSGDIGNYDKPLIRDPQYIDSADYVVTESTYGTRDHEPYIDHTDDFKRILTDTFCRGGNVVIPAFAVGRTQEICFYMSKIKKEGSIRGFENFEVWVDSPLAVEATKVFSENLLDCYDDETKALVQNGINPIGFDGLNLSITADDSKRINDMVYPKVIVSAAGMCDAGRIRHHLKYNLWREDSTVVFAGYQSEGTLGRKLQDGAETVKLFGDEIIVRAKIESIPGISSHADQTGLLRWISSFTKVKPQKVFVVHGEGAATDAYAQLIRKETGFDAEAPFSGSVFDLAKGEWITVAEGVPFKKPDGKDMTDVNHYIKDKAGEEIWV